MSVARSPCGSPTAPRGLATTASFQAFWIRGTTGAHVNLKQRLTSTENLLRSIRNGEAFASGAEGRGDSKKGAQQGSIWTRRISLGDIFTGLIRRQKNASTQADEAPAIAQTPAAPRKGAPDRAPASAAPSSATPAAALAAPVPKSAAPKPFWTRQFNFKRSGKALNIGVSVSGPTLCIAVVHNSGPSIAATRRFPMEPDQAPGESGFAAFWQACLASMNYAGVAADVWAVLRSADLDLNVLSVPKLAGGKLDAAVYWTLQKEKKFAEAEYILDYLVMGPTADSKTPKLDVLTCLARRADVERLRDSFREAGTPLAGITAIPNAFLGLYRRAGAPTGFTLAANIHVEPDFSAIGLYTKDHLLFSRFIRSGAGSMADTLVDHFQEQAKPKAMPMDDLELPLPGAPAPSASAGGAPLTQQLDGIQAQALLRHVLLGAPKPDFASPGHLLTPAQMIDIIAPAIERLARQVERTLDYYASSQQLRCDALHLSGDIFASDAIAQSLAGQLGFTSVVFDATRIVKGGDTTAPDDRMSMAPALAAALSPAGKGINLLSNYKVRTAQEAKRAVTSSLILGLAALMLVIGGGGLVLDKRVSAKSRELDALKTQRASLGPAVDEATLLASVNLFKMRQQGLRETTARMLASAALAEIALRTPEGVRLLSFTVDYPNAEPADAGAAKAQAPAPAPAKAPPGAESANGSVLVEGIVTGDKAQFDGTLSRFVLDLQTSPLFAAPTVNETGIKELGSGTQVLYFSLRLGVK